MNVFQLEGRDSHVCGRIGDYFIVAGGNRDSGNSKGKKSNKVV